MGLGAGRMPGLEVGEMLGSLRSWRRQDYEEGICKWKPQPKKKKQS